MSLLDRRLHVVTGKGGVGKSTVSASLALALQAKGRRVLVCEVTAQERVAPLLGVRASGPTVTRVDERIWSVHVLPAEAMREYGIMILRFKAVYSAVFENRLVRYFLRAVPSLPEVVMLGKIWWHVTQERDETGRLRWDAVIVDAPATGHGLTFLGTPRTLLEFVGEGPMMRDLKAMQAMLADPATTAVHLVTLPEEMPANEAIEMSQQLYGPMSLPGGGLFLNAFVEPRFRGAERAALSETHDAELEPARRAARLWGERQDLSAQYEEKLAAEVPLPLVRLPFLAGTEFDRRAVEQLARVAAELP
jgi:anion-transporting  ArsA/GET3 family ATPase